MKLRTITVNSNEYLWRVYSPNGDGDGGIGVKVWKDNKVFKDAYFQWGRVDRVSSDIVRRLIEGRLTKDENGCASWVKK